MIDALKLAASFDGYFRSANDVDVPARVSVPRDEWRSHYVPDAFLCHGDTGYGDYIIFKVGADGKIEGWKRPDIDAESWAACDA